MPGYQEILDLDFIREYGSDDDEHGSLEIEYETGQLLWLGEPGQKFRFWHSRSIKQLLLNSLGIVARVVFASYMILLLVMLLELIGLNPGDGIVSTAIWLWMLFPLLLISYLLFQDYRDFQFRRGSKYFVIEKGIGFLIGFEKKKKYLIKWDEIEKLCFIKSEYRLIIKHGSNDMFKNKEGKIGEEGEKKSPFFELQDIDKRTELLSLLKDYRQVKIE